ncbi:sugar ABC transporter substrate-binding protein [Fredinandcohnia onubensis]|uniref:sugar ABC transporter substrate-binding protein n=1 Tax=Fredinandcohnia onubensis TaxID=1571209 RepID=UPI000C0C0B3D|nr:sugar ABC transporter substrate-binding protein [Fredinandcohnia onubensis]
MKKLCLGLLSLLMVVFTAACSNSSSNGEDEIVIGVSMNNMATEYTAQLAKGVEDGAKELGVKVIVNDGESNANKQVQQIENFIAQKVDAIILQPIETDASSPAVEKAKEAGIPIINLNSVTTAEPDAFVGSRDEESAEIAINYIAEKIGNKGNIVMMQGYPGQSSEIKRTEGAQAILEDYPEITLIDQQTANWDRNEALDLMQNWLQAHKGKINGVFAQNDEMAMGALLTLENEGVKDDIVLVGVDAIPDALQAVKDGRLDATVFQNAIGQGNGSIETALKVINGEDVEKEVFIPFELVTQDNVEEYLK